MWTSSLQMGNLARTSSKALTSNFIYILFSFLGLIILLFVMLPILRTITSSEPQLLLETFQVPDVRSAITLTLTSSFIATALGFRFGIPLAYLLARFDFPGMSIVEGIVDLPVVIPHASAKPPHVLFI